MLINKDVFNMRRNQANNRSKDSDKDETNAILDGMKSYRE